MLQANRGGKGEHEDEANHAQHRAINKGDRITRTDETESKSTVTNKSINSLDDDSGEYQNKHSMIDD